MKKTLLVSFVAAAAASSAVAQSSNSPDPAGSYVVALDGETAKSADWQKVADALVAKYSAKLVNYDASSVEGILPELRKLKPRYVCFVTAPERAGRSLVVEAAQTLRKIDDDPYGDAIWGIVTGYNADDAMRMVEGDPIEVESIATSMGGSRTLDGWKHGFASDEGNMGRMWVKLPGSTNTVEIATAPNPAKSLAAAFRGIPVDYWVTSGHATEHDWQIIYNKPKGGCFVHKNGRLVAVTSQNDYALVFSPNPKVYIAAGNCLIGHVDGKDCMATAWMHTGGAVQMLGYTVETFYGFMGWGAKSMFESGRYTAAEAFYLNNQVLLWAIGKLNKDLRDVEIPAKEKLSTRKFIRMMQGRIRTQDELGLTWDRDTFAFYGDPARSVRFPEKRKDIDIKVSGDKITLDFLRDVSFPDKIEVKSTRPVAVLLDKAPARGAAIFAEGGEEPLADSVVTDVFSLIPLTGKHPKGEKLAFTIRPGESSAAAK